MKDYLKHTLTSEHAKQTEYKLNTMDESENWANVIYESNTKAKTEA